MYLICTYFNLHTAITQYIAYKQTIAPLYVVVLLFGGEGEIIKKTKKRRKTGRKCEKIEKSAGIIAFF